MTRQTDQPRGNTVYLALHWEIDSIVAKLRDLRRKSLEDRQMQDRPPKLPSREALISILDRLRAALFPNRLGLPEITEPNRCIVVLFQSGGANRPLPHEHAFPLGRSRSGKTFPGRGESGGFGESGRPSFGERAARKPLQRHARKGGGCAGGLHGRIRTEKRLVPCSRS